MKVQEYKISLMKGTLNNQYISTHKQKGSEPSNKVTVRKEKMEGWIEARKRRRQERRKLRNSDRYIISILDRVFKHWKEKNPGETPHHGWQRAGKTWQPSATRGRGRLSVVRETDVVVSVVTSKDSRGARTLLPLCKTITVKVF